MKRLLALGAILAVLLLSACGDKEEEKPAALDEVPEMVEVELTVPSSASIGEEVSFTAAVTQGEEVVDDADEVLFEIVNTSTNDSEKIDAELTGDKQYAIKYTFDTAGTYNITSHVTARDMHTMPTKQLTVAGGEQEESAAPADHSHGEEHHHGTGAVIEFEEGTTKVGEAVMLTANVSHEGKPLEGARVRYEIWRSDNPHHTWVEAPENEPGLYLTEHTFTESGTYEIQVHVTKGDDIHDHVIKKYTVN